jgi:hypothetical protein
LSRRCWDPSDTPFSDFARSFQPPPGTHSRPHQPWPDAGACDLAALQACGHRLSVCTRRHADVARLDRRKPYAAPHHNLIRVGERPGPKSPRTGARPNGPAAGEVRVSASPNLKPAPAGVPSGEPSTGSPAYLCNTPGWVKAEARGARARECDVRVIGAGTAGAPAGIAAARQESEPSYGILYQMGGVPVGWAHWPLWHGKHCGITPADFDEGVRGDPSGLFPLQIRLVPAPNPTGRERKSGSARWRTARCRKTDRLAGVVVITPDGERGIEAAKRRSTARAMRSSGRPRGRETVFINADEVACRARV